jgi:drug/metabolite transporter (DMT)-like permease
MPASRMKLVAAFAAVYVIWGSTYLAIRFAIETIPPFLMAGTRFVVAGVLLYAWLRIRGVATPARMEWRSAAIVGVLLLFIGNGGVTWAEQFVASGVTALLIATVPLWIVLIDWTWYSRVKPNARVVAGLLIGFLGIFLLVGAGQNAGENHINLVGVLVLMVATISWAAGSLYSRKAVLPASRLMGTAMQMLVGGAVLLAAGVVTGETSRVQFGEMSMRSVLSLAYLVVFGSLVAFSAYVWLLQATSPSNVATYAYVNPVIAVLLGWAFAGEPLTMVMIVAAAIIIGGVVLIINSQTKRNLKEKKAPVTVSSRMKECMQETG